jgi:hypothetical protein
MESDNTSFSVLSLKFSSPISLVTSSKASWMEASPLKAASRATEMESSDASDLEVYFVLLETENEGEIGCLCSAPASNETTRVRSWFPWPATVRTGVICRRMRHNWYFGVRSVAIKCRRGAQCVATGHFLPPHLHCDLQLLQLYS